MEFGKSTFPQYLVYSDLRNIHLNFALWLVTTHLLNTVSNYAAAKFATRVREIVKNENEPQKHYKWASVSQNHKAGHPEKRCHSKKGFAALWHITSGLARNTFWASLIVKYQSAANPSFLWMTTFLQLQNKMIQIACIRSTFKLSLEFSYYNLLHNNQNSV